MKKFDVIVGNPPYQNPDPAARRWPLWQQFIARSLNLSDRVAMIVPKMVVSPGATFNLIKHHTCLLNMTSSKYFSGVGSTFCYFILDSTRSPSAATIISETGSFKHNIAAVPFLPAVITHDSLSLIALLLSRKPRLWHRGELHTAHSDKFTRHGKYECLHTNVQTLRTDQEHENRTKIRVGVTTSGAPVFSVIQDCYLSQNYFWCEFATVDQAQAFAKECNGDQVQLLLKTFKWNGWNSREVINCL